MAEAPVQPMQSRAEDVTQQLRELGFMPDQAPAEFTEPKLADGGEIKACASADSDADDALPTRASSSAELLEYALTFTLPGMSAADGDIKGLWKGATSRSAGSKGSKDEALRRFNDERTRSSIGAGHRIFADPEAMKAKVRAGAFKEEYNVKIFYKQKGIWQFIATNAKFELLTLAVIGLNSIWLWIDCDMNDASTLLESKAPFQAGEHLFCFFFVFEWTARFMSFAEKRNCLRDAWFVFDTILVSLMVFETWIMTIVLAATTSDSGSLGNTSALRLLRLMRLTRISRLARLLRACPELLFMLKGMMAATRGVFFTMVLLGFILCVAGVVMRLLSQGTPIGDDFFPKVHTAVYFLGMHGALLDGVGPVMSRLADQAPMCAAVFAVVILLAALTMMNMLVGVLCEVVSAVAATETEEMAVAHVKSILLRILTDTGLDFSKDGHISKHEFASLVQRPDAVIALKEVGVDVTSLVDYADIMFQSDKEGKEFKKSLTFAEFMDLVLTLRDTNQATVKDVTTLRRFIHNQNTTRNVRLQKLKDAICDVEESHETLGRRQSILEGKVKLLRLALEPLLTQEGDRSSEPGSLTLRENLLKRQGGQPAAAPEPLS